MGTLFFRGLLFSGGRSSLAVSETLHSGLRIFALLAAYIIYGTGLTEPFIINRRIQNHRTFDPGLKHVLCSCASP